MPLRSIIELVLIVAAGVLGWFLLEEHEARVRAEAQQAALQEQADSAIAASARSAQALQEAQDAALGATDSLTALLGRTEALEDSLGALVASAEVRDVQASSDLDTLIVSVREFLPDEAQHLADSIVVKVTQISTARRDVSSAFEAQQRAMTELATQASATVAALTTRAEAAEALAESRGVEAQRERAAKEAAMALATPGVVGRIKASLPLLSVQGTVAAAIGAGVALLLTK